MGGRGPPGSVRCRPETRASYDWEGGFDVYPISAADRLTLEERRNAPALAGTIRPTDA